MANDTISLMIRENRAGCILYTLWAAVALSIFQRNNPDPGPVHLPGGNDFFARFFQVE